MALIKCPECGKEISDKAKHCIFCGYPISELNTNIQTGSRQDCDAACRTRICDENVNNITYNIVLKSYNERNKLDLINYIRTTKKVGLKDAKYIIDNVPQILQDNLQYDDAKAIEVVLNNIGSTIEIIPSTEQLKEENYLCVIDESEFGNKHSEEFNMKETINLIKDGKHYDAISGMYSKMTYKNRFEMLDYIMEHGDAPKFFALKQYSKEEESVAKIRFNGLRKQKEDSEKIIVKCPYCKSSNTIKISQSSKVGNTLLFGVFGTKRHKNYHCNNCGSDW